MKLMLSGSETVVIHFILKTTYNDPLRVCVVCALGPFRCGSLYHFPSTSHVTNTLH